MRKQNSTFKTSFISEAGSELKNQDYFAFVELEKYACYVIADGLNERQDTESARLASQSVIVAFQEHPSIRRRALRSYLAAADRVLAQADTTERLKASLTVVVTDYANMRYGHAGNTRLRLYRNGIVREQTEDTSLGKDMLRAQDLSEDMLSRHEQRNNLYTYLGKGKGFQPVISKKFKLENGDIIALYTRGIWENLDGGELDDVFSQARDEPQESLDDVEELLLSKQPGRLENYTLAAIFVDKIFLDPDRKRKIRKIVTVSIVAFVLVLVISLVVWLLLRQRRRRMEEMELRYTNMTEYIEDSNYIRAQEECAEALKLAEKLRDKDKIREISAYQKLIEAVNAADASFEEENYEEAQTAYMAALERSRYADRMADAYIDGRLSKITAYLSVFDYIRMGDALAAVGDYVRAEEKYMQAREAATRSYFEDGRKDAIEALTVLYESRSEAEAEEKEAAKERALAETGATGLMAEGDKAFAEGDYEGANAYYAMALEKYQEIGDDVHAAGIQTKIEASTKKAEGNQEKCDEADACLEKGKELEQEGSYMEAKKQYQSARNIYRELGKEEEAAKTDGLIELLETTMAIAQEKTAEAESDTVKTGAPGGEASEQTGAPGGEASEQTGAPETEREQQTGM